MLAFAPASPARSSTRDAQKERRYIEDDQWTWGPGAEEPPQPLSGVGRRGEQIGVTECGRPVARITSIGSERRIDRLVAEGIVSRPVSIKRPAPPSRASATEPVSTWLGEERC